MNLQGVIDASARLWSTLRRPGTNKTAVEIVDVLDQVLEVHITYLEALSRGDVPPKTLVDDHLVLWREARADLGLYRIALHPTADDLAASLELKPDGR